MLGVVTDLVYIVWNWIERVFIGFFQFFSIDSSLLLLWLLPVAISGIFVSYKLIKNVVSF